MHCRRAEIAQAREAGNETTGALRIRAERLDGRTVITEAYRTAPFKLAEIDARDRPSEAEVIIQSVGPGYLPGDRIAIEISAGPDARLTVRDQAALKLFPSPRGERAHSRIRITADERSFIAYLPGELISYRGAIYEQRVSIEAASSAQVAYAEIITPGRIAMGERFAFTRLDLGIGIAVNGKPILRERNRIEPASRFPAALGRNGTFNCVGALYLVGPGWRGIGSGATEDGARWAADDDGRYVLVRYAGQTAQRIHQLIAGHLMAARSPIDED